jgi:hypothetical protein
MTQLAARQPAASHAAMADSKASQTGGEVGFVDQRGSSAQLRQLASMANDSPRNDGVRSLKQLVAQSVPKKPNNTGLPTQLKEGIENLSGMSMDHVKVHYNSSQPAQLQAHAFAQGSDIHVAPGQEQHLPHEAWHVVQQAKGRVRPTLQMKGAAINDDSSLEREADVMGARALQMAAADAPAENLATATVNYGAPVQRYAEQGEYLVSESQKFAVTQHGEPGSQMYVRNPDDLTGVDHVVFEPGGRRTIGDREYTSLTPRYESVEAQRQMERMYCGQFSRHATNKTETQESNDAPAGRSLFMRTHAPTSAWENHYAPVIIQDGGDRGTFETAVGLNYMFFGIYGQALDQSFAYKTELAGMILGLRDDTLSRVLRTQILERREKGQSTAQQERDLAQEEEARAKAELIIPAMRDPHAEPREGTREAVEPLIAKIREHRAKQFDLRTQLEQERLADEANRARAEERQAAERRRNERNVAIGVTIASILAVVVILLAIFL